MKPIAADKPNLKSQSKDIEAKYRHAMARWKTVQQTERLVALPYESKLKKQYEKSLTCSDYIKEYENSYVNGFYCKKRFCVVCNRIRTAALIDAYEPTFETWPDKQFVTLTRRNVSKEELADEVREILDIFCAIKKQAKKSFPGKGKPKDPDYIPAGLSGLRKLEVTYNDKEDSYHPHFHVIVENFEQAAYLKNAWLRRNPEYFYANDVDPGYLQADAETRIKMRQNGCKRRLIANPHGASHKANDMRPATDSSVKELFKYFAKLVNKTDKVTKEGYPIFDFHPEAMDAVFCSMVNVRVIQPFGNLKAIPRPPVNEENRPDKGEFVRGWSWWEMDWECKKYEEKEFESQKVKVYDWGGTAPYTVIEKIVEKKIVFVGTEKLTGFKKRNHDKEWRYLTPPEPPPEVYVDLTIDYGSGSAPF